MTKLTYFENLLLRSQSYYAIGEIERNGEPFADLEYILKNTKRVSGMLHRWVEA